MTDTTHLALPLIAASQAQKHVTHNQALVLLDAIVQLSVKDATHTAPPGSPAEGDRYLVAAGATGAWSGWSLNIALYTDGAWARIVPQKGWLVFNEATNLLRVWSGSGWTDPGLASGFVGIFYKSDAGSVGFTKTGVGTVSIKAGTVIELAGLLYTFVAATAVQMPSLSAGTDYAIYLCNDGTVRADANFSAPSGFSTTTSRQIGGFHYAPGGNAAPISKAAVTAGTAIGAQTVPINTWALYLLSIAAGGTITVIPAAANATTGYASEALAIAAMPAIPASNALMGYITVQTKIGTTWVAGTDALVGGASGNVANATNYYPSLGSAQGLTLSRGSTDTNIASTAFSFWLGGDTTPGINAYSLWDLKWRPACADPRGMALIADRFWADIYLCGVDHYTNGTSRYNVTIADGSSPPKMAAAFGGDGSLAYSNFDWWKATEVMQSAGKDLLTYGEFCAAAFGTMENSSFGSDPGSTILREAYTSKWGVMLASGNMWIWGKEFGGPDAGAAWANTNGGRGQVYQESNAVLFGGSWANGAGSGSRASLWDNAPSNSSSSIGARGRCDHLHHV